VPSEESKTPRLPICSRSSLPSCEYSWTMPVLGSIEPHMTLAVDRAAVEILGKQVCISPRVHHIALGIKFNHGRRRLSGVQLVIGQSFRWPSIPPTSFTR